MDGEEHRRHRRLMQDAFSVSRLTAYQPHLHRIAETAIARMPTGPEVDLRVHLKALALDIALEVFVGERLDRAEADRINSAFVDLIEAGGALLRLRIPGTRWDRGHRARRIVDELFADLVTRRRARPGDDLMSSLCMARTADGAQLSDDQIIDHMRFMLFAAHDTATIAMTSMTYRLGRNMQWQSRLRDESMAAGDNPTMTELRDSPVMQAVFAEALRLRPPVPVIPRAAVKDTALCGYHIPAGTFVIIVTGSQHRLPEIWPQPDVFDPTRFLGVAAPPRHRMAWMPFGGGAHQCIGMRFSYLETATVLHHLVRRFDWTVAGTDYETADTALTTNVGFTAHVSTHHR